MLALLRKLLYFYVKPKAVKLKNQPLVSICIPTYNGADYIVQAMDSALAQTYPNLEIVVSDDASVDTTLELITSYKNKTSIPIYIHHHTPNGIGANWNHCITKAKGKYIKFLFQDDILLPECVATMVKVMDAYDDVGIVASKREFIVESSFLDASASQWITTYGNLQQHLNLPVVDGMSFIDHSLFGRSDFFESPMNKIGEPTTMLFKKELIAKIGPFREDLKQVLDYEFCYRVLPSQKIAVLQTPLVQFRLHGAQTTVVNKYSDAYAQDYKIYEQLVYVNYFKFLNAKTQKRLSIKYNTFAKVKHKISKRLKRLLNK